MRNIGDLVISRARLADTLGRVEKRIPAGEWRTIQENAIAIDRQLRTLREGIMRVRLVPVGEIFRRMPFVVRDLARESGKRVRLELKGQSTEIDKFLIERMMDPVLQLVRNAVSHGIETADERIAAGKRPRAPSSERHGRRHRPDRHRRRAAASIPTRRCTRENGRSAGPGGTPTQRRSRP
jgi:two-component system chemotaxis sensor kinase CheA